MTQVPLPGEQSALRGYRWQYDHVARLVYDALVEGELDRVVLASTEAGQIDDLLLILKGRREAYQFKGAVSRTSISLSEILRPSRTASGTPTDSLWHALARAWLQLRENDARPLTVHLSMAAKPSTADHVIQDDERPVPDHFRAFLARGLEPVTSGAAALADLPQWHEAFERLRASADLPEEEFIEFLGAVRLDLDLGEPLLAATGNRREDLKLLSDALLRQVATGSGPVELDRAGLIALVGWSNRLSFRSAHEFPVDRLTYSPLGGAIEELNTKLEDVHAGYVAITGPPGSGKSTLLTQVLSGSKDRIVRYYAFVPGDGAAARNRLSAEWFLHDLSTMLRDAGLRTLENNLPSQTVQDMRQAIEEQLDAAGAEYEATGHRTIIVVDGLDHVQRDYSGNDALTAELPRPSALPSGVTIVVGTRDLAPLPSEARQQVNDLRSEVNLEKQRLSRSAMLQVCERFEATKWLPRETHELIVDRSAGHPLSFAYVLASVEDFQGDNIDAFVESLPQYNGDIAMLYRAVWDSLDAEGELERVLRVCSRLRVGFDLEWIRTWAPDWAARLFRTRLRYLFRVERKRWRFFHDSFRQYARERTSIGDDRVPDPVVDREAHAEVANICEESARPVFRDQALYHRSLAQDFSGVRRLGSQENARRQFSELRPAGDIADDAKRLLTASAHDADFPGLLRGLLILSEVSDKSSEIEEIDVCRALWRSGLTDLAIDYVGDEQGLRVPLPQAYHLAADLATENYSAGKRIFDLFQHLGFDDRTSNSRGQRDTASGWARCAAHFLRPEIAISRIRALLPDTVGDRDWEFAHAYSDFEVVLTSYVDELDKFDRDQLKNIDDILCEESSAVEGKAGTGKTTRDAISILASLRVELHAQWLSGDVLFEEGVAVFESFRDSIQGSRVYVQDLLKMAELDAKYGSSERAMATLHRTQFDGALTLSELGASGDEGAIDEHFRFWRLRHQLEFASSTVEPSMSAGPLSSKPASARTPAGDGVAAGAPIHAEAEAIVLAARIDEFVRRIALLQAVVSTGTSVDDFEAWEAVGAVINLFPPTRGLNPSNSLRTLRWKREELHLLAIDTLAEAQPGLAAWYEQAMSRRLEAEPEEWPASLRVTLGIRLSDLGIAPSWLHESLEALEAEATQQGVNGALLDLLTAANAYSELGEFDSAQRVCKRIWTSAFGLGSRNDYQFSRWVEWFGRASVRLPDVGGEAMWLARLLVAAEPISDQSLGAEELPAAVVVASPRVAISTFEFLVSHGVVTHMEALANLLRALVAAAKHEPATIRLASEMTAGVLAACSNTAAVELGRALRLQADRDTLVALQNELDKVALPSTREDWRRALGFESPEERTVSSEEEEESYGGLQLEDGSRLSRAQVRARAVDLESLRILVGEEAAASYFDWVPILEESFGTATAPDLAEVFLRTSNEAKVLVWLAERDYERGDFPSSMRLARSAYTLAPLDAWSRMRNTVRRDAVRLLVKTGDMTQMEAAADFVNFVTEERWYSSMLATDVDEIFDAIGVDTAEFGFWETVRQYLEGLADNVDLPTQSLKGPALKWWIAEDLPGYRSSDDLTAAEAVAELAVMHLTHPAWAVREGSIEVVASALDRGSNHVVQALERLILVKPTEDVLETVGGILAASASPDDSKLTRIWSQLVGHPNFIVRRLSAPSAGIAALRIPRSLAGTYYMHITEGDVPTGAVALGDDEPFLAPFEPAYQVLAAVTGLELRAILVMAERYSRDALLELPGDTALTSALSNARMRNVHPSSVVLASRAAFGRVLGDLADSGQLVEVPQRFEFALRTGDLGLVGHSLDSMPEGLPTQPPAGHDQTAEIWAAALEARADEYVESIRRGEWQTIGAFGDSAVLNWAHLEETFSCVAVPRWREKGLLAQGVNLRVSDLYEPVAASPDAPSVPLLLRNHSNAFMERRSDWIALNPVIARLLSWQPDPPRVGGWRNSNGELVAETRIWTNGTWGRHGQAFDDVVSEGTAVLLSEVGLQELVELLGPIDLVIRVSRGAPSGARTSRRVSRRVEL